LWDDYSGLVFAPLKRLTFSGLAGEKPRAKSVGPDIFRAVSGSPMYLTENRCRRFGKDLKSENVESLECNYSEKTGLIRGSFAETHKFVVPRGGTSID
jgi:hypothetical protein